MTHVNVSRRISRRRAGGRHFVSVALTHQRAHQGGAEAGGRSCLQLRIGGDYRGEHEADARPAHGCSRWRPAASSPPRCKLRAPQSTRVDGKAAAAQAEGVGEPARGDGVSDAGRRPSPERRVLEQGIKVHHGDSMKTAVSSRAERHGSCRQSAARHSQTRAARAAEGPWRPSQTARCQRRCCQGGRRLAGSRRGAYVPPWARRRQVGADPTQLAPGPGRAPRRQKCQAAPWASLLRAARSWSEHIGRVEGIRRREGHVAPQLLGAWPAVRGARKEASERAVGWSKTMVLGRASAPAARCSWLRSSTAPSESTPASMNGASESTSPPAVRRAISSTASSETPPPPPPLWASVAAAADPSCRQGTAAAGRKGFEEAGDDAAAAAAREHRPAAPPRARRSCRRGPAASPPGRGPPR